MKPTKIITKDNIYYLDDNGEYDHVDFPSRKYSHSEIVENEEITETFAEEFSTDDRLFDLMDYINAKNKDYKKWLAKYKKTQKTIK